jgi:hypothetical protein
MKKICWDVNKNLILKIERGISFDDVIYYIENGKTIDIIKHPNQLKYSNQKIFIIQLNDYIFLVPFVENQNEIFLKTIIPSRKATIKYLGENYEKENYKIR